MSRSKEISHGPGQAHLSVGIPVGHQVLSSNSIPTYFIPARGLVGRKIETAKDFEKAFVPNFSC